MSIEVNLRREAEGEADLEGSIYDFKTLLRLFYMYKAIADRLLSNPIWRTLYGAAVLLGLAQVILIIRGAQANDPSPLIFASGALFATGFVVWLAPIAYGIRRKKLSKIALTGIHASAIVLSIVPAREAVSVGLGLPPADFDLTVAIFSLVLYPLIWLYISVLISAILYFVFLMYFFFAAIVSQGIIFSDLFMPFVEGISPKLGERYKATKANFYTKATNAAGHFIGITVITFYLVSTLSLTERIPRLLTKPVRAVAYFSDYYVISAYPGISPVMKAKLHSNGIVSYAILHDLFYVDIVVDQVNSIKIDADILTNQSQNTE